MPARQSVLSLALSAPNTGSRCPCRIPIMIGIVMALMPAALWRCEAQEVHTVDATWGESSYHLVHDFGDLTIPIGSPAQLPDGRVFIAAEAGDSHHFYGGILGMTPIAEGVYTSQIIYTFPGGSGGAYPYTDLAVIGNTLFGATYGAGANNTGVYFSLNPDGSGYNAIPFDANPSDTNPRAVTAVPSGNVVVTEETAGPAGHGGMAYWNTFLARWVSLHLFNGDDGAYPMNKLCESVSSSGTPQQARIKTGGAKPDGLSPVTLYGVTLIGGTNGGFGTVFEVNDDATGFQSLHSFGLSGNSANSPIGGMVLSGNTLYGTTSGGGSNSSGTVFQINTDGSGYRVLHHFSAATYDSSIFTHSNSDGCGPRGDLVLSGDLLFGTTYDGGTNGGGTVFMIDTNGGNFTVLHSFSTPIANGSGANTNTGGGWLTAGLLLSSNTLVGTTSDGGANGGGVVFALIRPTPPSLSIAPAGDNFALSWPSSATNFLLQQSSDLTTTNWSSFGGPVTDDGTNKSVHLIPGPGNAFFRLSNTNGP